MTPRSLAFVALTVVSLLAVPSIGLAQRNYAAPGGGRAPVRQGVPGASRTSPLLRRNATANPGDRAVGLGRATSRGVPNGRADEGAMDAPGETDAMRDGPIAEQSGGVPGAVRLERRAPDVTSAPRVPNGGAGVARRTGDVVVTSRRTFGRGLTDAIQRIGVRAGIAVVRAVRTGPERDRAIEAILDAERSSNEHLEASRLESDFARDQSRPPAISAAAARRPFPTATNVQRPGRTSIQVTTMRSVPAAAVEPPSPWRPMTDAELRIVIGQPPAERSGAITAPGATTVR